MSRMGCLGLYSSPSGNEISGSIKCRKPVDQMNTLSISLSRGSLLWELVTWLMLFYSLCKSTSRKNTLNAYYILLLKSKNWEEEITNILTSLYFVLFIYFRLKQAEFCGQELFVWFCRTPYLVAPSFAQATVAMYTYSGSILALFLKTIHRV
jgi:hypothetical protein